MGNIIEWDIYFKYDPSTATEFILDVNSVDGDYSSYFQYAVLPGSVLENGEVMMVGDGPNDFGTKDRCRRK